MTILQFVWLGEIIQTGMKLLGGDGEGLSIARGDDEKVSKSSKPKTQ